MVEKRKKAVAWKTFHKYIHEQQRPTAKLQSMHTTPSPGTEREGIDRCLEWVGYYHGADQPGVH